MATLPANVQDPNQQAPTGGPTTVAGTGGAPAQGQGTTGAVVGGGAPVAGSNIQSAQAPQGGSNYTDVGAYLNANQAGAQNLGNTVAKNLTNTYNTTKSGIDTSAGTATQAANAGYTPENTQLIQQVSSNPTGATAQNVTDYQSQLNDVYGGPMGWADYGAQQGNVNNATQYGGLTKTPGGLNVLSQGAEGPTGSQGVNQLDTMLLGGNQGAMNTIQSAADPYNTLNDYLNTQNTGVNNAVQAGQTGAQTASQDALNAFTGQNGTLTNLNTQIGNETSAATAAQQKALSDQAALKTSLGTAGLYNPGTTVGSAANPNFGVPTDVLNYSLNQNAVSPQQLQAMGVTPEQWQALQGSLQQAGTSQYMTGHNFGAPSQTAQQDLSQYLTQQQGAAPQAGTVANANEYAQMGAIQNILGSKNPQGNAINPAMANLAGTYDPNTNTNSFDYAKALADTNQFGTQSRADAQNYANQLTSGADAAHAASQHRGGVFGGLARDLTNPLQLSETLLNPMSYAANTQAIAEGKQLNPTNINQPYAKEVAPVLGGVFGGILGSYGGPAGTYAGQAAGAGLGALAGGPLENLGGKKTLAHGGEVPEKDVESYLDKRKK